MYRIMKWVLVISSIFLVANALSVEQHWVEFKRHHGKTYKSLFEERHRYEIFKDNLQKIEKHNERYARGEVSYEQGITVFADKADSEFPALMSKFKVGKLRYPTVQFEDNAKRKESVNWVQAGAVTEVKDQIDCGACWAMAVVQAVESSVFISTGKLQNLSVQNLIDCSRNFGNNGCIGGGFQAAFSYIEDYGLLPEKEYPYTHNDGICKNTGGVKIDHHIDIPNSSKAMEYFIANSGPICCGMLATSDMLFYGYGVMDGPECKSTEESFNHAVLVVGYGIENDIPYWLIKNSWGDSWGKKGYFKLKRGDSNIFCINLACSLAVV